MVKGEKNNMAFDPMEPDSELVIGKLTESEASVRISSAAGIRAEILPHVINQSTDPSNLFNVMFWIDIQNQRDNCYEGYGPGLTKANNNPPPFSKGGLGGGVIFRWIEDRVGLM